MGSPRRLTATHWWSWVLGGVPLVAAGAVAALAAAGPWPRRLAVGLVVAAVAAAACVLPLWHTRREVRRLRALGVARDEALRQLVARGSHDLRTPLNTLAGMADTLARRGEQLEPSAREELYLALQRSTRRVAGWITVLLDAAVSDPSHTSPTSPTTHTTRRAPTALQPLLEEAVTVTHAATAGLRVELVPTELSVLAEPGEVVRVVSNLLANAGHHAGDGTRVVVEARARGARVEVAVRDHGVGWQAAEPSPDGSGDDRRHLSGHGLGLESVRAQVTAWGGQLELDDTPGGGATIRFTIPRARPDEAEGSADHEQQWTIAGRESHVRGLDPAHPTHPTQQTRQR